LTRINEPTFEDILHEVRKFTYKPGWRIIAHREPSKMAPDAFVITVIAKVPNVDNPDEMIEIGRPNMYTLADIASASYEWKDYFHHMVLALIRKIEMHEIDEWLKIDGKNFRNPHPELVPAT
jgi:hypothetical protein